MGGTTNSQALRFPYVTETISDLHTKNFADDCATALAAQDVRRTSALKRSIVEVERAAALALADGSNVTVPWDTEVTDPDNLVNVGGGTPSRITIPAGLTGIWYCRVQVLSPGATGWMKGQVSITVTGNIRMRRSYCQFGGGDSIDDMHLTAFVPVPNAGDYIEVQLLHVGGGSTNASDIRIRAMRRTA